MNRRSFLQSGAAASVALMGAATVRAEGRAGDRVLQVPVRDLMTRNQNRSTVACMRGLVCASQPLAAQAGVDILKAGGNAIDAAIAANAMLALTEPMSCGPGGDLFALVWSAREQKLFGLNASGRAPFEWNLEAAHALGLEEIPGNSPLAWSVPGCVSGWEALLARFGAKPLADVLAPAIDYARSGFPVSPIIAATWAFAAKNHPTLAETYMPGGERPGFGDVFKNPQLADFFEVLVRDGARAFYEGEIAERIVGFSQEQGGRFSLRDFREHTADWVDPITTGYRGYEVWQIPPSGQGLATLQMLNLLEHFDIGSLEANGSAHLHLFAEAKKLAYEDRAKYYADPKFAEVPVEWLVSKAYAKERAALIDPKRANPRPVPGEEKSDTVYLTAADGEGNMVSLIQSIYAGWGSHYVPAQLGFALQNRGESFALDPAHRNRLEPGKRPFHTIIPGFVTREGAPVFSFGVMGGDFQPQGHVQILMNLLDFGLSPQQAGEQPRVQHSGGSSPTGGNASDGGRLRFEAGFDEAVKAELAALGHTIDAGVGAWGGYQGIWREENPRRYFGASDPRKDGAAIGY